MLSEKVLKNSILRGQNRRDHAASLFAIGLAHNGEAALSELILPDSREALLLQYFSESRGFLR